MFTATQLRPRLPSSQLPASPSYPTPSLSRLHERESEQPSRLPGVEPPVPERLTETDTLLASFVRVSKAEKWRLNHPGGGM